MGKIVVIYFKFLDEIDFYMVLDMFFFIDEIKVIRGKNFKCIEFIKSIFYYISMFCSWYCGKIIFKRNGGFFYGRFIE